MTLDSSPLPTTLPTVHKKASHVTRARFSEEDKTAIAAYLARGDSLNSFFGREAELAEFETLLSEFFGRKYSLLLNSGTSALHAAYFALGLGPGDNVIVPTYTHHATVMPLLQLGCAIRFADCSEDTGNIDPDAAARLIDSDTKAIVVTHQWGHPVEALRFRALADMYNLFLVEDLSLAVGASVDGRLVGTFGHAACFSLGSTKMFSGGQGGGVLFDDPSLYERAILFGHFGQRCFDDVQSPIHRQFVDSGLGLNLRMHVLAVVVSMARFKRRDSLIAARHERFNHLTSGLRGHPFLRPPVTRPGCYRGQWQGYCVGIDSSVPGIEAASICERLNAQGLQVSYGGYQRPLHTLSAFRSRRNILYPRRPPVPNWKHYRAGDCPVAERFYNNSLGFPLFLDEPMELVDRYIEGCWNIADSNAVLQKRLHK
jgi:dTDP-4-amino-4,6-dideoxygalactose transaminase